MIRRFKSYALRHRYQIPITFFISVACLFFTMHCGKTKDLFPQQFLGKWTTEADRYKGRHIEFSRETIIFGTGEDTPNIFFIREVEQKLNRPGNEYVFRCIDKEHTEFIFDFFIEGDPEALTLRLKNPREVAWKKETERFD